MKTAIVAGVFASVVYAWVDPAPSVTDGVAMKELGLQIGFSPKPTTAPIHRDLLRRQAGSAIVGYLAPDNTCGYVDGRIGGVKTCDSSENCAAVLGDDDFYTMGCCGTGMCTMYGACYDYASMTACDHACEQDANVVKCSSSLYPYCYGYSVPGMSMGFYSCDSISASTFDEFDTTYSGETGAQTWLALRESDLSSILSTTTTSASSAQRSGVATIGVSTTSTSGSQAAASTSSAPAQTIAQQSKKSTPIGAIVGGAVAGVAVLGAVIGAIVFFLLRKKRNAPAAGPSGPNPHMSQYGAPTVPPAGPSYPQNLPPHVGAGNTTSGYFAPPPMKLDGSDNKYHAAGVTVSETHVPVVTPVSPLPAYSAPVAGPSPPHMVPSPGISTPPSMDPRFSAPPPPSASWVPQPQPQPQPQTGHPPTQQIPAPIELGSNFAVPSQYQGRPVYEAA